MEVLQCVKILPSLVLVLLQEHLEPSRCWVWKLRQRKFANRRPGPPWVNFSKDLIGTILGDLLKSADHSIQAGQVVQNKRPSHHLENRIVKIRFSSTKRTRECWLVSFLILDIDELPHVSLASAGYRFDNRQIIESSLDSKNETWTWSP